MTDKRNETRKPLHVRALMVMGEQRLEAKTLNISAGGMTIHSPLNLKTGTQFGIVFQVHIGSKFFNVQAECEAIYSIFSSDGTGFKTGLRFINVTASNRQTITDFLNA